MKHDTHITPIRNPIIYDTTLREGLQTPGGVGANLQERTYIATLIAKNKFADWIELGMPANKVDARMIESISKAVAKYDIGIGVLARVNKADIDAAHTVMKSHAKSICHLFIGTSDEHRAVRFGGKKSAQQYCDDIREAVDHASNYDFKRIMFSPEDAMRTYVQNKEFFFQTIAAAISGYKNRTHPIVINLPDTTGISTTAEFLAMLDVVNQKFKGAIDVSIHSHNDSGHATSHAIESIATNNATWIQTCFGGIGERNGITATESLLAQLDERGIRKIEHKNRLVPTTNAILAAMGRTTHPEAAVSGAYTNITASGIHADVALKDSNAYHARSNIYGATPISEFGPTSGAAQVVKSLSRIGIDIEKQHVAAFTNELKEWSNYHKSPVSESQVISAYIGREKKYPLQILEHRMEITNKDSVFWMKGMYNQNPFEVTKRGAGDYRLIIDALQEIMQERIPGFAFSDFNIRVVPKIPEHYLTSNTVPKRLDLDSMIAATTIFTTPKTTFPISATCVSNHSMQAMMQSAIDAAKDAALINEYIK